MRDTSCHSRPGLFVFGLFVAALVAAALLPGGPVLAAPPTHTYTNSIGMEFILIPAGTFRMGCSAEAEKCDGDEKPLRQVTLTQHFYLSKHEVTQAQWEAVMGNNPSVFRGADRPVENVSWDDAQQFVRKLNEKEGTPRYRLPTEAEWEYAARAGSTTAYSFGDDGTQLGDYAWYKGNAGKETHQVGQKRANAWGLFDMHGNVWEWVADWYAKKYDGAEAVTDPRGPEAGEFRVYRGGSRGSVAESCRTANRRFGKPDARFGIVGFRLAISTGH